MPVELAKFLKHAGFTLLGGAVAALIALLSTDTTVAGFVSAHPYLGFVVPLVSGALGSLSAWLNKQ